MIFVECWKQTEQELVPSIVCKDQSCCQLVGNKAAKHDGDSRAEHKLDWVEFGEQVD